MVQLFLGLSGKNAETRALKPGSAAPPVSGSSAVRTRGGVFGSGAAGCYPDATVEGLYTLEAGQTATGSILDWYRRHFAGAERLEAERRGVHVFQVLDELAAAGFAIDAGENAGVGGGVDDPIDGREGFEIGGDADLAVKDSNAFEGERAPIGFRAGAGEIVDAGDLRAGEGSLQAAREGRAHESADPGDEDAHGAA